MRRIEALLDEIEAIDDDLRRVEMSCEELVRVQSNDEKWFMREEICCDISESE